MNELLRKYTFLGHDQGFIVVSMSSVFASNITAMGKYIVKLRTCHDLTTYFLIDNCELRKKAVGLL